MTGKIVTYDGNQYLLPTILEWKFEYATSSPCDSFSIRFLCGKDMTELLSKAVRFQAEENGERVFTGVVDEFSVQIDKDGMQAELVGRGMAALLLDNEAEAADYDVATWADILRRHVEPYGIRTVGAAPPPAHGFSVAYGSSEWQVIYEFARYWGGSVPRFDRAGCLVTGEWDDSSVIVLDDSVAVSSMRWRERRYGVLSQVNVRDKTRQTVELVENSDFIAQGGCCRRWYTVPGKSNYQAMRYRGQYQLERSEAERYLLEITVPQTFFAFPGELVQVERNNWGCNGIYRVAQAISSCGANGAYTTLLLSVPALVG